jgi:hypothetical protein
MFVANSKNHKSSVGAAYTESIWFNVAPNGACFFFLYSFLQTFDSYGAG